MSSNILSSSIKNEEDNTNQNINNKKSFKLSDFYELLAKILFMICAGVVVLGVVVITVYIFIMGLPAIFEVGIINFVTGTKWIPSAEIFGILPMIVGSIYVTIGAVIIGVPVGIFTSVYMSEYAPKSVLRILNPAIELLAGIPSVVYGFFGLVVIVPIINDTLGGKGAGSSLISASIILGIMILPTIITTTKTALLAVPKKYKEGAYALGATKVHTIFSVIIPAGKSGVLSGVVLGIGRAIGETMAVILVAGNSVIIPTSVTDPVRTMTANIAIEMGYSTGLHQEALFATGVILFIFIMSLNVVLHFVQRKEG
ncbi:MAG: phosphate ABC transporter permease subunit PstC [Tyzzerella sp.]|uniref:Phosphate transport system permease protein n=1 Tax=Candidatus Fimicola merdigallinarum TaxID=2840819 RepID=A0A9D9H2B6_9FIRM|nr:phosphate ABC transporter permease subunit PstC [Candidatus Fimicola merdigallinarum]